jgi:hypothetical protein
MYDRDEPMMKRAMRGTALAALLLTLAVQNLLAAPPAVLEKVPADAAVVVVVKDLKAFTTKLSNTGTRMNIPGVPADMLGELTKKMHLGKGFDVNGSAAFAYSMPATPKEGETAPTYAKPFLLLLPTTDSKSMLEELKPGAAENGISEVTIPGDTGDETGFVSTVGNFVAFTQDKDFLTH